MADLAVILGLYIIRISSTGYAVIDEAFALKAKKRKLTLITQQILSDLYLVGSKLDKTENGWIVRNATADKKPIKESSGQEVLDAKTRISLAVNETNFSYEVLMKKTPEKKDPIAEEIEAKNKADLEASLKSKDPILEDPQGKPPAPKPVPEEKPSPPKPSPEPPLPSETALIIQLNETIDANNKNFQNLSNVHEELKIKLAEHIQDNTTIRKTLEEVELKMVQENASAKSVIVGLESSLSEAKSFTIAAEQEMTEFETKCDSLVEQTTSMAEEICALKKEIAEAKPQNFLESVASDIFTEQVIADGMRRCIDVCNSYKLPSRVGIAVFNFDNHTNLSKIFIWELL